MVRCHLSCIRSAADAAPTGRARCPNPLGEPFGGTLWGGGAAHNPSSCCRPLSPITAPRPCRPASYQGPTRRRPQPLPRARRRRAGGAAGAASAAAAAAAQHNTHRVAEWCSTGPHTCRPPRRSQPHRRHRSREAIKQNPRGTPPRPPQPPAPPSALMASRPRWPLASAFGSRRQGRAGRDRQAPVRHCLCLAFLLPSCLRQRLCLAFLLSSWLRQRLCLAVSGSSVFAAGGGPSEINRGKNPIFKGKRCSCAAVRRLCGGCTLVQPCVSMMVAVSVVLVLQGAVKIGWSWEAKSVWFCPTVHAANADCHPT